MSKSRCSNALELKEVGAVIALWSAPYGALEWLAAGEKIRQYSIPLRVEMFGADSSKVFRRMDLEKALGAEYIENFIIRRADLHSAILIDIAENTIHTDYEGEKIEQKFRRRKSVFQKR